MRGCGAGARPRHWLTLLSGMLECLGFAGVVFGFASLVFVLKEEGYFGELCGSPSNSSSGLPLTACSSQDEQFSMVFTIASFLNNFLSLVNGYLFDRFGTMVTRLLGISLYTTGTLLVAFSSAAFPQVLFPALSCLAVGGILLLITNMQVGNLFAAHRSTIITLYNGAFDSSSAVFFVIKVLHEQGVSLRSSFLVLSLCSLLLLARTFLLLPRGHIPHPLPEGYSYGASCGRADGYEVKQPEGVKDAPPAAPPEAGWPDGPAQGDQTEAEKGGSFRSCVLSWFFLWHLLWLSIMQLRHYLFIGTLNPRLGRLAGGDPALVSRYTNAFAFTQLLGVLCAPWNGLILDRHRGRPRAAGVCERQADLRASVPSLLLTAAQSSLFSLSAAVPRLRLQYLTFILQVPSVSLWEAVRSGDVAVRHLLPAAVPLLRPGQRSAARGSLLRGRGAHAAHPAGLHPPRLRLRPLQEPQGGGAPALRPTPGCEPPAGPDL
ncbi:equilibrative nucleobase transporter 1-like isoform 2-T3 [Menidia menidia]